MASERNRIGKYNVVEKIAQGAMGSVYKAEDPNIKRQVAIKLVNLESLADDDIEESKARFKREAQAAGRLNHPNIVGVYEYGEENGDSFLCMEFIDGQSLRDVLKEEGRLSPDRAIGIILDVLAGLGEAHKNGVVHRDVKPANVMIAQNGTVKVTDFGIAHLDSSSMTHAGTIMGTPAYMAPEQVSGGAIDARSDIYGAGALLYHMLSGEKPFSGSMTQVINEVLNAKPKPLKDLGVALPTGVEAAIAKAMDKVPENRFPDTAAFANALNEAKGGEMTAPASGHDDVDEDEATMVYVPPSAKKTVAPASEAKSKTPMILAAAVTILAVVGAGGWFFLGGGGAKDGAKPVVETAAQSQETRQEIMTGAPQKDAGGKVGSLDQMAGLISADDLTADAAGKIPSPPDTSAAPANLEQMTDMVADMVADGNSGLPSPPKMDMGDAGEVKMALTEPSVPLGEGELPPPPAGENGMDGLPPPPMVVEGDAGLPPPPTTAPEAEETASLSPVGEMPKPLAAAVPDSPPLLLGLAGNKPAGQAYRVGESVALTVLPSEDAHVYCYYEFGGSISRVFPNRFSPDSLVPVAQGLKLPSAEMGFKFTLEQSGVSERFVCFASREDLAGKLPQAIYGEDLAPVAGTYGDIVTAFKKVSSDVTESSFSFSVE